MTALLFLAWAIGAAYLVESLREYDDVMPAHPLVMLAAALAWPATLALGLLLVAVVVAVETVFEIATTWSRRW